MPKTAEEPQYDEQESTSTTPKLSAAISGIISGVKNAISKIGNIGKNIFQTGENLFNKYILKIDSPGNSNTDTTDESTQTKEDSPEFTHTYGQWELRANDNSYSISNKGENREDRFYKIVPGDKYNEPLIEVEPSNALPIPSTITIKDINGNQLELDQKIGGIICEGDSPQTPKYRFSLSNPNNPEFTVNEDGSLTVNDETFYLTTIFQKDKNRFINYDAYFGKTKPPYVIYKELEDLDLFTNPLNPPENDNTEPTEQEAA